MAKRIALALAVVVLSLFSISTVLFILQGGFGAGHGRYDLVVAANAMPWRPIMETLPSWLFAKGDYIPIVLLPALLNLALTLGLFATCRRYSR
jgi:hypothetical protein